VTNFNGQIEDDRRIARLETACARAGVDERRRAICAYSITEK
jgi:hypothetical protein